MFRQYSSITRHGTLFLFIALCMLFPQRSLGDNILAIESFSQGGSPLNNTNGGSGWAAPWQVQNGSIDVPGYDISTTAPVTYPGLSTSGGYAIGGDAWQTAGRMLDTSAE